MLEHIIEFISNPGVLIAGVLTCVEIAPIKINPIQWLLKKAGEVITHDVRTELQEVKSELQVVKAEVQDSKVQSWRWNVLDFANSCRYERRHTSDEWKHVISQLADYEQYIEKNDISNGVFEEDAAYLRKEYQEHCNKHDFL